ncbi:MAG: OmpA family protein [Bacteroidales bacterium]|nr:OmpA family protein [Bacteroidales bacterium]
MKKIILFLVCAPLIVGCGAWSNLTNGALIGSGAGAALGAGIGYLIGKDGKSAAIGAAIGTAAGAGTGAVIGKKMDKKAAELAALKNAEIETVEDVNGFKGIKVTFNGGILFDTNKAVLSASAKSELQEFANKMADMEDTNITIYGHTDNTGTYEVNQKVSNNRADAVEKYLKQCGISTSRMTAQGLAYDFPVADNETAEGRAQNRRVEIYITANEEMIEAANNGSLE